MRYLFLVLILVTSAFGGREVAITIDDLPRGGGDPGTDRADTLRMTTKLLEPFQTGHIPVIGFVNECRHSEVLGEALALWIAAGAELGNHTCSHADLNSTPVEAYKSDILNGEKVTTEIVGRRPRYFRHPLLHAGKEGAAKSAIASFLIEQGYIIAPVTFDNSDYMFAKVYATALAKSDSALASRVRDTYLSYMESIYEFFEKRSVEVTGHEIRQTLLIHANQLNADTMPQLLAMMKRRGYSIVTLDRALEDPAYKLPEQYIGPGGFSWIHRWSKTKGLPGKGEPEEPVWIRDLYNQP
jgi:peptidoglycan/xylan/chitin deacetylase (PgdA/CDA1 family)